MPRTESYKSDVDDTAVELSELVTITVTRAVDKSSKTVYLSEDQLGDLMEESDTFGALVLTD